MSVRSILLKLSGMTRENLLLIWDACKMQPPCAGFTTESLDDDELISRMVEACGIGGVYMNSNLSNPEIWE